MNPQQYLKDYYSKSPNDGVLDQLKNFGAEAGGGKAALNGILTGISSPIKAVADTYTIGTNKAIGALIGKDLSYKTNKQLNDSNNFFTNDSLTDSVNEHPVIDALANFGTSLIGGGLTKGIRTGINKGVMFADNAISNSIAHEQEKNNPLTLKNIGKNVLNGVGNVAKQPIKAGVYAINAFDNMLASTDDAQKRVQNRTQNQLNSVDNFFNYK